MDTMWRQYRQYVNLVGLGGVKKTEKFDSLVESVEYQSDIDLPIRNQWQGQVGRLE